VEEWLGKVEEGMFGNLRKLTKAAITDFEKRPRTEWVTQHASQVSYFPLLYSRLLFLCSGKLQLCSDTKKKLNWT